MSERTDQRDAIATALSAFAVRLVAEIAALADRFAIRKASPWN